MWASAQVRGRITDEMTANWRASFTNAHRTPSPRTGALSPFSFSWLHKFIFAILLFIVVYRPLVWIAPSIPTYLWTPLSAFLDRMAAGIIWFLVVAATLALLLPTKVIARFRTRPEYKRTVLNIKRKYAPLLFAVLLPLIGLAFASHYLFNIRDSFGSFCEESRVNGETIRSTNRGLKICTEANRANCARIKIDEAARPACGSSCTGKVLEFDTRSLCTATGIFLEKGARYHLLLEQKGPWTFAWTPSDTRGMPIEAFDPPDNSPLRAQIKSYAIKLLMLTMYPLKRTFDRPWGHVITRYGSTGTEENFIDPGEERRADRREELFTPTRDGEMFIYLNQPVLGLWPDALGFFNSGTAVVTVTRVPRR